MFLDLSAKIAFVHIPRTGGVWLTGRLLGAAVAAGRTADLVVDQVNRHVPARQLRTRYGVDSSWFVFAIVRPPWEIIRSDFALTMQDVRRADRSPALLDSMNPAWADRVRRTAAHRDLATHVRVEYETCRQFVRGGFWATYATTPGLTVLPFHFPGVADVLTNVCELARYPRPAGATIEGRDNVSPPDLRPELTRAALDRILSVCGGDVATFRWPLPDVVGTTTGRPADTA